MTSTTSFIPQVIIVLSVYEFHKSFNYKENLNTGNILNNQKTGHFCPSFRWYLNTSLQSYNTRQKMTRDTRAPIFPYSDLLGLESCVVWATSFWIISCILHLNKEPYWFNKVSLAKMSYLCDLVDISYSLKQHRASE